MKRTTPWERGEKVIVEPGAPFFGPNAKPFFLQFAAGLIIPWVMYQLGLWHLIYDWTGLLFDFTG